MRACGLLRRKAQFVAQWLTASGNWRSFTPITTYMAACEAAERYPGVKTRVVPIKIAVRACSGSSLNKGCSPGISR
jgi:hypothetical protein